MFRRAPREAALGPEPYSGEMTQRLPAIYLPHGGGPWPFVALRFGRPACGSACGTTWWPAPGDPVLAPRVQQLLDKAGIQSADDDKRGFDHGTFVPLRGLRHARAIRAKSTCRRFTSSLAPRTRTRPPCPIASASWA